MHEAMAVASPPFWMVEVAELLQEAAGREVSNRRDGSDAADAHRRPSQRLPGRAGRL